MAHSAAARATSVAYTAATRTSARNQGELLPRPPRDPAVEGVENQQDGCRSATLRHDARALWKGGRSGQGGHVTSGTSSRQLDVVEHALATPSAHDACPAAVTGIMPIRQAGEARSGLVVNSGKGPAGPGDEHVLHVVGRNDPVPLQALVTCQPSSNVTSVSGGRMATRMSGRPGDPADPPSCMGRKPARRTGVTGSRAEPPCAPESVAAVDRGAPTVGEELPAIARGCRAR